MVQFSVAGVLPISVLFHLEHFSLLNKLNNITFLGMENIDYQQNLTFEFTGMDGKSRLRELILYISAKCSDDPTFGATKLNKILFFSDFAAYYRYGKPISGIEYQRLPNGPAPKQLMPVRTRMEKEGDVAVQQTSFYNRSQHRCIPLRDPDLSGFTGSEIAVIDEIIHKLWGDTATEVSRVSHQRAWRIAKDMESIPYQAVFLSNEDWTDADLSRLSALNAENRWE